MSIMQISYQIFAVGVVHNQDDAVWIDIYPDYLEAMSGLEQFSHINVFYWFNENDTLEKRRTLQVHPCGNEKNPLTGVFATHSPLRPNLIALTRCKIRGIEKNRIIIDAIDARDGSPVIDIKSYFPSPEAETDVVTPRWERRVEDTS